MPIIRHKGINYAGSTDDISNSSITYESGDELDPSAPSEVAQLTNTETTKSFAKKVSTAVKNIRYLLKMLGTTDISGIGDGTTTGAIKELDTDISNITPDSIGAFPGVTIITTNKDFNNYKTSGAYSFYGGQNIANNPLDNNSPGSLVVIEGGPGVRQFVSPLNNAYTTFTRWYHIGNDQWFDWLPVVTTVKGDKETAYRGGLVNLTPENIGALSTAGGEVSGSVALSGAIIPKRGMFVSFSNTGGGTNGTLVFARLVINSAYINYPIEMEIGSRNFCPTSTICIRFGNNAGKDPALDIFVKWGHPSKRIFIKKTATSTWDLAAPKDDAYGTIEVLSIKSAVIYNGLITITYPNELIPFTESEWTEAQWGGKISEAVRLTNLRATTKTNLLQEAIDNNQSYIGYVEDAEMFNPIYGHNNGMIISTCYSLNWIHQIFCDYYSGSIAVRGNNNGTWKPWRKVVDHLNFRNLIPEATTSASGFMSAADKAKLNSITTSSSRKYKKNITEMDEYEARKLLELTPVRYDYINEEDGTDCYGLIAEDVAEIMSYPVVYVDGEPDAINYSKFVPYLIKLVQIQSREIEEMKKAVGNLHIT